ncbi:phosphate acyltransferase [Lacicoccus alkaliphilus]|uniref:Phosphate butyryltransferase n=1 Tax=Lacicoccus alkaliphilus DSM 16010 TaxID=1123231 RepID=A0A1M7BFA9_9BACL|nr:phosphate acyltransferase [Salinicoccus alkaliphilus]SHL53631.1 phosphate butyryltransferase [Salinicoccus alkaliphilus DSM 16010]
MEFDEIFSHLNNEMVALSISRAADETLLRPVLSLMEEYNISVHLVDDEKQLKKLLESMGAEYAGHPGIRIHHAGSDAEAAEIAVELAADGTCDILMKGALPTSIILKAVLNKKHDLIYNEILSHIALFDVPNYHKAFILTDAAMNIAPGVEEKRCIINNAVDFAHTLNIMRPKVALLSAVEKINPKISSTVDAKEVIRRIYEENMRQFIVDGPLQYDLAISKESAAVKNIDSEVAGDADILIAPQIEAGNILYKSLVYSAGARVAAVIVGAKVPIVLTSRADSAEDKFNSICLAMKSLS